MTMARRQHLAVTLVLAVVLFLSLSYFYSSPSAGHGTDGLPSLKQSPTGSEHGFQLDLDSIPSGLLAGDSIAPKLENATLKAELGRATWKFMHTMVARFPDKPTADDRKALETFVHLFGRLYPCGECAQHFRQLLAEYPPQTSSRNAAAGWLCFAHNLVNERLGKPVFDCNKIGDFYDCGCGDEDEKGKEGGEADAGGGNTMTGQSTSP